MRRDGCVGAALELTVKSAHVIHQRARAPQGALLQGAAIAGHGHGIRLRHACHVSEQRRGTPPTILSTIARLLRGMAA